MATSREISPLKTTCSGRQDVVRDLHDLCLVPGDSGAEVGLFIRGGQN